VFSSPFVIVCHRLSSFVIKRCHQTSSFVINRKAQGVIKRHHIPIGMMTLTTA
jgi:hypothetical protein